MSKQYRIPPEVVAELKRTPSGMKLLEQFQPDALSRADHIEAEMKRHRFQLGKSCTCGAWTMPRPGSEGAFRSHVARQIDALVSDLERSEKATPTVPDEPLTAAQSVAVRRNADELEYSAATIRSIAERLRRESVS